MNGRRSLTLNSKLERVSEGCKSTKDKQDRAIKVSKKTARNISGARSSKSSCKGGRSGTIDNAVSQVTTSIFQIIDKETKDTYGDATDECTTKNLIHDKCPKDSLANADLSSLSDHLVSSESDSDILYNWDGKGEDPLHMYIVMRNYELTGELFLD